MPSPTSAANFDSAFQTLHEKRVAVHKKRLTVQRKMLDVSNHSDPYTVPPPDTVLRYRAELSSDDEEHAILLDKGCMYALELSWRDSSGKIGAYTGPISYKEEPHGIEGVIRFYDACNGLMEKYEGDWKDGKKCGRGTETWADGSVYEGTFESDQRHGRGVFRSGHKGEIYQGEWSYNHRHGLGIQTFSDGSKYRGEWWRGAIEGEGMFEFADGSMYEGKVKAGKKHGLGIQRWKSGQIYKGMFVEGQQQGHGLLTSPDGTYYTGAFKNNKMHGTLFIVWLVDILHPLQILLLNLILTVFLKVLEPKFGPQEKSLSANGRITSAMGRGLANGRMEARTVEVLRLESITPKENISGPMGACTMVNGNADSSMVGASSPGPVGNGSMVITKTVRGVGMELAPGLMGPSTAANGRIISDTGKEFSPIVMETLCIQDLGNLTNRLRQKNHHGRSLNVLPLPDSMPITLSLLLNNLSSLYETLRYYR